MPARGTTNHYSTHQTREIARIKHAQYIRKYHWYKHVQWPDNKYKYTYVDKYKHKPMQP